MEEGGMQEVKSVNIGKDSLKLSISNGIIVLITLISSMLLSRFRTLEEYGTYSQILTMVTLAISLFSLGLPNSSSYFLATAEAPLDKKKFLSGYYSVSTVLSVVAGVLLLFAVPLIERYYDNPAITTFAYVLAILPWTKITISSIGNVLVAYGQTTKLMLVNITNAVLTLSAVLLVQVFDWSFYEYMLLYVCAEVIISVWVYVIVNRLEGVLRPSTDFALFKKIFAYSIPIGLASVVGTLNIELDKLMIGFFMDTESVAIYANAGKELPLTIVATALTAVLMPQMVKFLKAGDNQGAVDLWGDTIRLSYYIIAFFATACIVFAPQIMTILYSEKYLGGVQVFRIYSLVLLMRTTYFGIVLNSVGKTKFIFYCSCISLGLNVVLNFLFFYLFGFIGPAIASLLSLVIVAVFQLIVSAKTIKIPFKRIFPWKSLGGITLFNIVWGALAYAIVTIFKIKTDALGLALCIGMGVLFAGAYLLLIWKKLLSLWRKLNNKDE